MKRTIALCLATLPFLPLQSFGYDLSQALESAMESDPQFLSAQQTLLADEQVEKQARGGLLPTVTAQYSYLKIDDTSETAGVETDQEYDRETTTVSLVQPLFRPDSWYGFSQAKALTNAAQARFAAAEQDLLFRTASRYLDVLRAWDELVASQAAERAFERQLKQSQERFDVGLLPITDVQESKAVYDLAKVNLILAQSNLQVARDALQALTGDTPNVIHGLREDLPISGPEPADPNAWMERALANNPDLQAARLNADAAKSAAKRGLSQQLPTVDLVGQYQQSSNDNQGNNALLFADETEGSSIGIEVTLPLFTGGTLNSQRLEASYRYQASEADYELIYRNTSQTARSLTQVVAAKAQQVLAQKQALISAESALNATESGYEVGTRSSVDLLDAQSAFFRAQRDYAFARYDYLQDSLNLKAVAGMLSKSDINEFNQWLTADVAVQLTQP